MQISTKKPSEAESKQNTWEQGVRCDRFSLSLTVPVWTFLLIYVKLLLKVVSFLQGEEDKQTIYDRQVIGYGTD